MRAAKTILLAWLIAGCHGATIQEAGTDGGTAGRGGGSGAAGTGSGAAGTGTGGTNTGGGGAVGAGGAGGACGRCETHCTNGVCDVAKLRAGGTSSQVDYMAATLNGDRLYFATTYGGIGSGLEVKSMPKQGGQEQSLFTQQVCAPQSGAAPCELTVVVDDSDVFFTGLNPVSSTAVLAVPKGGGDVRTVCTTGNSTPGQLALEGSNVYWYRGANGIERCPKAGGASTPAASATGNILRTASRPGGVVWAAQDTGVVTLLDTGTLTPSVLGVTVNPQTNTFYPGVCDVVDDGTLAYWVLCSWPHIVYVEGTGNNPSELGRALAGTSSGSTDDYGSIGVDGNYVYFTEVGFLNRVSKTGGPVEPRGAVVDQNRGTIKARIIGVDEKYVYLHRRGGYLYRVVK